MTLSTQWPVVIIGAGPAGLMAADCLSAAGCSVTIYEAMPTAGRKFLMAGRGGLNLTHSEPFPQFVSRFSGESGGAQTCLQAALTQFPPSAVREWADALGADTFVGSSGRVFPKVMKAAPLLRAWLQRLSQQGVRFELRHRWAGWTQEKDVYQLAFQTPDGLHTVNAQHVLLALGGASWPRLGSTGDWQEWVTAHGVDVVPFKPANCGFEVTWSDYLKQRFAGQPLKQINLNYRDPATGRTAEKSGDCVLSHYGLEGGAVYALSTALRLGIERDGQATLMIDLLPQSSREKIQQQLSVARGGRSWSSFLQSRLGLKGVKLALLNEGLEPLVRDNPAALAERIKALPVCLNAPRPLAEAISSAGGVTFSSIDEHFQLKTLHGVFCAGEMLDWEAPTGGYLLTACLATGRAAAMGMLKTLKDTA